MTELSLLAAVLLSSAWTHPGLNCIDPAVSSPTVQVLGTMNVVVSPDDDADDDGGSSAHAFAFHNETAPPVGGPWLGLQFGPVSKALSTQLRLEKTTGQMVMNVIEGGPADLAGLQQYDVITAIDGRQVSSDIGAFMEIVKGYKPGETHAMSVVRGGQPVQATLTVAARPEQIGASKFKSEDDEFSHGQVFNRGGMLQKDDTGNWVFKGFNMPGMPDVWKSIPLPDDKDFLFAPQGDGKGNKFQMFMKRDNGKAVRVEKGDDGKITVITTVNENGKETTTTKTYSSMDELQASDPDAAKMLTGGPKMRFGWSLDGAPHFEGLSDEMKAHIEEAMKNAEQSLGKSGAFTFKVPGSSGGEDSGNVHFFARKARTSFEMTPDGRIKVTTRKGDEELTTVYDNAEALRQANPDAHKRFQRLQEAGKLKN